MEYKLKPDGYKTVNQWKKEGKIPVNREAIEKYYATTWTGELFLKDGQPCVYEYVSPQNVIDVINEEILDTQNDVAFRGQLSFLSNMYLCQIEMLIQGKEYTFPSVENAYQALKAPEYAQQFIDISPAEAKILGKGVPCRKDWDNTKHDIMKSILRLKFMQHPELLEKLKLCNFSITERNTWGDTYWGTYKGIGENHLGNILEKIKCDALGNRFISSCDKAIQIGNETLSFQNSLSEEYGYKKLPETLSYTVRAQYARKLPNFYMYDDNKKQKLHSRDGVLIAEKWNRIVIGDYGAFVEIDDADIHKENIKVKPGEEYRINDPKYREHVKYHWYIPKNGYPSKIYFQQAEVTYADYKRGKWYISPHETKEGLYLIEHQDIEVSKTVEKTLTEELDEALLTPYKRVMIPYGIVVFDVETTGFSKSAEVIQISIYDIFENPILETYVKPRAKSWDEAMAVNHITPEMVKDAPTAPELAARIRDIFNSADRVVGFNVSFDARMVEQSFGTKIIQPKLYDTYSHFKKEHPETKGKKLEDAVKVYCPELYSEYSEGKHDAGVDTRATVKIFLEQTGMGKDKDNMEILLEL